MLVHSLMAFRAEKWRCWRFLHRAMKVARVPAVHEQTTISPHGEMNIPCHDAVAICAQELLFKKS
jgi:hypothetical protein